MFCPSYQEPDFEEKDTYRNIAATGEFVVNFVNEDTVIAMDATAAEVGPDVDEFMLAGVTPLPSNVCETAPGGGKPDQFRMPAA